MGTINTRGKRFQCDYTIPNGARLRPSFDTYDQANEWLRTVEEKVRTGQDVSLDVAHTTRAIVMNLRELAEEVLNRHWRGCKSELSLWRNAKDVYLRLGASRSVKEVDERLIDDLVYQLERDGKANGTINRRLAALSKMLRHAYRRGYVQRIPVIERKRLTSVPCLLTPACVLVSCSSSRDGTLTYPNGSSIYGIPRTDGHAPYL